LNPRLKKIVNKIKDESLRAKVAQLLENPTMEIDGKEYMGASSGQFPSWHISPSQLSRGFC